MKILVCLKQVVTSESELAIDADGVRITAPAGAERRLGRYDACALEAALQLRENWSDVTVEVITAGPPEAADVLRRALGMGADEAVHIVSAAEIDDPAMVAGAIAAAVQSAACDLILTGVMSEDLMQAAVGPTLAVLLDRPCATDVVAFDLTADGLGLTAEEEIEQGQRHRVRLSLPAVLTLQSGPWLPRYPSLSGLLRARRKPIRTLDLAAMGLEAPRRQTVGLTLPPRTRSGRILVGTADEKAVELAGIFRQRGFLSARTP